MKLNDTNSISYYVVQNKTKDGTLYLASYDFSRKGSVINSLFFDPVFHKAKPFTKIEVENFLNRLASNYFPETIEHTSCWNLGVIELTKTAKCLSINQFGNSKNN